jgi:hypothetical protein
MMTNTEEESAPTDEEIIEALKTTVIWLHRAAGILSTYSAKESAKELRMLADRLDSHAERLRARNIQNTQAGS